MLERFLKALVLYLILTPLFLFLEHFFASVPEQPKFRRGFWLDSFYWFVTPMVSQILSMVCIGILFLPIYWLLGRSLAVDDILAGYGPIAKLPLWLQGAIAVVIGDFIGYWTHRLQHRLPLWHFHAVHHSADIMDWLSAVRLHPVNDVVSRVCQASPVLLLGISPLSVELYAPFLASYVALIHANVSWNYGPLKYLISSPVFHRWHHTMDEDGQGKNYAGLFPIFDVIFGTFYMPAGQQPGNFGISDELPEKFFTQLMYPFRQLRPIPMEQEVET